nr:MAG TPA: hypothetical protein [Caudoviricetes sp.]
MLSKSCYKKCEIWVKIAKICDFLSNFMNFLLIFSKLSYI